MLHYEASLTVISHILNKQYGGGLLSGLLFQRPARDFYSKNKPGFDV